MGKKKSVALMVILTIVIVALCAVAIGALDFAFSKGVTAIVELFV